MQLGQQLADIIYSLDDVCAGLPEDDHQHCRMSIGKTGVARVLNRVLHVSHVAQPHACHIVAGYQDFLVIIRFENLVIVCDLPCIDGVRNLTFRAIGVCRGQGGLHLFHANSQLAQQRRIQFGPNGRPRSAAHKYLSYSWNLRNFLRQDGISHVIHAWQHDGVRGKRHDHDGRVRGIHFAVVGPCRQICRKLAEGRIDGRLHVASCGIDVAVQVKLECDISRTQAAG